MKPEAVMQELWRSKDERASRFGGDVRALCRHLMEKQRTPRADLPFVQDFAASQAAHRERIAKLPPPVPGDLLLPGDPIIAEVRAIRAQRWRERDSCTAVVREEQPKPGQ